MHIHYQVGVAKNCAFNTRVGSSASRDFDELSFVDFVATRRYTNDISWDLCTAEVGPYTAGYIYDNRFYIQELMDGSYYLSTDQGNFHSAYLMELETVLFSHYLYM